MNTAESLVALADIFAKLFAQQIGKFSFFAFKSVRHCFHLFTCVSQCVKLSLSLLSYLGPITDNYLFCAFHKLSATGVIFLVCFIRQAAMQGTKHEFYETCHSVTFYFMKKDSKRCCDTTTPESFHTKDESKRGSAFAFIFGVN